MDEEQQKRHDEQMRRLGEMVHGMISQVHASIKGAGNDLAFADRSITFPTVDGGDGYVRIVIMSSDVLLKIFTDAAEAQLDVVMRHKVSQMVEGGATL